MHTKGCVTYIYVRVNDIIERREKRRKREKKKRAALSGVET